MRWVHLCLCLVCAIPDSNVFCQSNLCFILQIATTLKTTQVNRLEQEDPSYLEQLEREALLEDPEIFAEMITQIISKDASLLKEISAKLSQDKEIQSEMDDMLKEGETLEDRPDALGLLLAKYLSEDPSLLDEFDELFSIELEDDDYVEGGDDYDEEDDDVMKKPDEREEL
jgi:hypothetical protein